MNKTCRILVLVVVLLSAMSMVSQAQLDYGLSLTNFAFYNDGSDVFVVHADFNLWILDPVKPVVVYARVNLYAPEWGDLNYEEQMVLGMSTASINTHLVTGYMIEPDDELRGYPLCGSAYCYVKSVQSNLYEVESDSDVFWPPY